MNPLNALSGRRAAPLSPPIPALRRVPGGGSPPLMVCLGTRPEIIKMAPVCHALRGAGVPLRLLHTGQHEELAWPLYDFFGLKPDAQIRLLRHDKSLAGLSAELLREIDRSIVAWQPAAVLVHGDTSSAAMGALAAFYRHIPVAHVEAGLRSHHRDDPFPEEFNRSMIARVATWHFAPTEAAVRNLSREGIGSDRTFLVGNTIVDATRTVLERLDACADPATGAARTDAYRTLGDPSAAHGDASSRGANESAGDEERLLVVTAHRRENWGAPLAGFVRAIGALLAAHPLAQALWTLHANPEVAATVQQAHAELPPAVASRLHLVPPLDYPDMIRALGRAWLVLTDSGGIQEEACALNAPVLVLRSSTERPELLETGAGRLVGTDPFRIVDEVEWLWQHPDDYQAMRTAANPFGDGQTAARIADILSSWRGEQTVDEADEATLRSSHSAPGASTGSARPGAPTAPPVKAPPPTPPVDLDAASSTARRRSA